MGHPLYLVVLKEKYHKIEKFFFAFSKNGANMKIEDAVGDLFPAGKDIVAMRF